MILFLSMPDLDQQDIKASREMRQAQIRHILFGC